MFDYDRLANLFVCLVLLGLFVIVFHLEMVLPALRQLTYYLTQSESTAAPANHHRRKLDAPNPALVFLLEPSMSAFDTQRILRLTHGTAAFGGKVDVPFRGQDASLTSSSVRLTRQWSRCILGFFTL